MNKPTHFIGIGGIGMSGLAKLLLEKNQKVTGSDQSKNKMTEALSLLGASIYEGHHPDNLPSAGRVVISSGISKDNPELAACQPGHEVIHRSQLLNELMSGQKALLVAGTHGKTTTSSLLASVLTEAGRSPSWAVGGLVSAYGTNAALGSGEYFVAEADESDGTHLNYQPYGLILTNLNEDHLDFYKTKEALVTSFELFIAKVASKRHFFWCKDAEGLKGTKEGESYGFSNEADLQIMNFRQQEKGIVFDIVWKEKTFTDIELPLLGRHNALNGCAVFGLSLSLGLSELEIRSAFKKFAGAKRRLDIKSNKRQVLVIDDYAHHPSEIKATLQGLKEAHPLRRLVVLFQPHRFTRTRDCFEAFIQAFKEADVLFLTDIYSAGESPIEGMTSQILAENIKQARFIPRAEIAAEVAAFMRPFDVVVTMGAGDITKVSDELATITPKKLKTACIFGGKSKEHEVTFMSARSVTTQFDADLFEVEVFAISKNGAWCSGAKAKNILHHEASYEEKGELSFSIFSELKACDLVFPVLHGTCGEDGVIQGFFETIGLPYIGSNLESSAVAMNKSLTKKIVAAANIPVASFVSFTESEWRLSQTTFMAQIKDLKFPLFVKPVHLGSSVGIFKVNTEVELYKAIASALEYDSEVLVEEGVKGREIEVAILGRGPWFISNPGEIHSNGQIYHYEGKYGEHAIQVHVTADLTPAEQEEAKQMALYVYRQIGCEGMARVDLFLTDEGFMLNEVNTIPGFTQNSLYPKMCEASGVSYTMLLSELSKLALTRKAKQDKIY